MTRLEVAKRALVFCLALVFVFFQFGIHSFALSPDQAKLFHEHINYFNIAQCSAATASPSTGSGVAFDDSQSSDTGNQTTIDDDGIDPSPTNSPDHQSSTSYANGQLGALHTNYIALNPGWAQANGLTLGDVATLTYKGKTVYAVYGDNHVGNTVHSEISVAAAKALGTSGNDSLTGVHTVVYPGTSAQLAGSVDQNKIDQIGAQASGGGGGAGTSMGTQCCPSSGTTTLNGSDNAAKIWNWLVGTGANQPGFTNAQAAGVMGNMEQENSFHTDDNSGGMGIVQWTAGRRTAEIALAQKDGLQPTDLIAQLNYLWAELTDGPGAAGDYRPTLKAMKAITDNSASGASAAADAWEQTFEHAKNGGNLPRREALAVKWFNNAKGMSTTAPSPTDSSTDSTGCSGDGAPTGAGGYSNPFHDMTNVLQSRIDEGVDYLAKPGTTVPVYAIGNGIITKVARNDGTSDWWRHFGGYSVVYKLTDGPAKDDSVYVAEWCPVRSKATVDVGKTVTSGTALCDMTPDSIETGWALSNNTDIPAASSVYKEGFETAYGVNFNQLLVKLGAPPGHLDTGHDPSGTVLGKLPNGWPTW